MYKLYDPQKTGIIGPRFEHAVRNAMLTIMVEPGEYVYRSCTRAHGCIVCAGVAAETLILSFVGIGQIRSHKLPTFINLKCLIISSPNLVASLPTK